MALSTTIPSTYRVLLDRRWELEDFADFSNYFEQVYLATHVMRRSPETLAIYGGFLRMPEGGGYSTVNFYNHLKANASREIKPVVKEIRYSSPGWIELYLNTDTALIVAAVVASIAKSIDMCNTTYNNIKKGVYERKKLRRNERIATAKEEEYFRQSSDRLAKMLGVASRESVDQFTKSDGATLKLLMGLFRRFRIIADLQQRGKIKLPLDETDRDSRKRGNPFE